jgi:signal transduction histidine kinase
MAWWSAGLGRVARVPQKAEESITQVRTTSYLLEPPLLQELGLKSAIPWYLDGFSTRSGIKTTVEVSPALGRRRPKPSWLSFACGKKA